MRNYGLTALLIGILGVCVGGCSDTNAQGVTTATILISDDLHTQTQATAIGDRVYFVASVVDGNRNVDSEPWVTDGSVDGTFRLADINPGDASSIDVASFVEFEGRVYFLADDGIHGLEIWRTDGTRDGTELFIEIVAGSAGLGNGQLVATSNRLYFSTQDRSGPDLVAIDVMD